MTDNPPAVEVRLVGAFAHPAESIACVLDHRVLWHVHNGGFTACHGHRDAIRLSLAAGH